MSELLKSLLEIHSPSGEEVHMKNFLLNYIQEHSPQWKVNPKVIHGPEYQDCLMLLFGNPETAAFAHMDTTGFTVRYQDQLIPIGSPDVTGNEILTGSDQLGRIECSLSLNEEHQLHYKFGRAIQSGTSLVYKQAFKEDHQHYHSPYLDNRIGIYNLLKIAENLENGALVFSCWEEHGGGSVPYLVKVLYEKYGIRKMLVSDVTWISDGIAHDEGVVISYRDRNIPRRSFIRSITNLALDYQVPFQIEVEAYGSSDAREIQLSPYPIDWCFVGPPCAHAHSNVETVAKKDVDHMITFYRVLMERL